MLVALYLHDWFINNDKLLTNVSTLVIFLNHVMCKVVYVYT